MFAEWFWANVEKTDGCWPWTRSCVPDGYGSVNVEHRGDRAHRIAYRLTVGDIPEGLCVCHTCDNPACCNPEHLWLGTHGDNMQDKARKGRGRAQAIGEANGRAKLTESAVAEIRSRAQKGRRGNVAAIAAEYGISHTYIYRILNGENWSTQ